MWRWVSFEILLYAKVKEGADIALDSGLPYPNGSKIFTCLGSLFLLLVSVLSFDLLCESGSLHVLCSPQFPVSKLEV